MCGLTFKLVVGRVGATFVSVRACSLGAIDVAGARIPCADEVAFEGRTVMAKPYPTFSSSVSGSHPVTKSSKGGAVGAFCSARPVIPLALGVKVTSQFSLVVFVPQLAFSLESAVCSLLSPVERKPIKVTVFYVVGAERQGTKLSSSVIAGLLSPPV